MNKPLQSLSKQERQTFWKQIITEWRLSGKDIVSFCRSKKVAVSSFYQWRGRFDPTFKIKPKEKNETASQQRMFVPIQIKQDKPNVVLNIKHDELTIHYPNGCFVSLASNFDPQILSLLNKAMGV